ncbi:hypothetical protein SAY86_024415 [Trapa natans]|uniref:Uncharacterized protein n=1 Tax=Trapa natans TaxID=22666 RepID=A0AAN7M4C1_TRANT|nr:hypothetical protein SAY86_024415 [Trapa natans]
MHWLGTWLTCSPFSSTTVHELNVCKISATHFRYIYRHCHSAAPLSALFALPSRRAASSTPSLTRDLMYILCQQRSSSSVQLGFLQLSASPRVFL